MTILHHFGLMKIKDHLSQMRLATDRLDEDHADHLARSLRDQRIAHDRQVAHLRQENLDQRNHIAVLNGKPRNDP